MNETYANFLIQKLDRKIVLLAKLENSRDRQLVSKQTYDEEKTRYQTEIRILKECLEVFSGLVAKQGN